LAHRVLSLKYRPQTFDDITGQQHVVMSLRGGIKTGRIGHAFLFAGPRGVGKTTTARIFAKSLNCSKGPTVLPCQQCQSCKEITLSRSIDVVEIDGASNRGIEEIRSLREGVKYAPLHGKYKVYIIDEVHSLTPEAFNALLKTLEEPPANVVFIFATTNPTKVPPTILSRCQRFMFKRLSIKEISQRLTEIAAKEQIAITPEAIHYIAVRADGSIRDGESILEQLAAFVEGAIKEQDVFKLIGFLGYSYYHELLKSVMSGELNKVLITLNRGIEEGADPAEIYRGFTQYVRNMLLAKSHLPDELLDLNVDEINTVRALPLTDALVIAYLEMCLEHEDNIKRSVNTRIALELLFSQLALLHENPGNPREFQNRNKPVADKVVLDQRKSDVKSVLIDLLQQKSPQLAGVIQKANVVLNGDTVDIHVENDFAHRQLHGKLPSMISALQKVLRKDVKIDLHIDKQEHKESDLVKNIKGLFDGEEVR
jgi:DNA polymerase-3 subunit gamma/tau